MIEQDFNDENKHDEDKIINEESKDHLTIKPKESRVAPYRNEDRNEDDLDLK